MPYPDRASLPVAVKKLPTKAQDIWRAAWNSAYAAYDPAKHQADSADAYAFATAWAAVKRAGYHQDETGKWLAPAGKMALDLVGKGQGDIMVAAANSAWDLSTDDLESVHAALHAYYTVLDATDVDKRRKVINTHRGILQTYLDRGIVIVPSAECKEMIEEYAAEQKAREILDIGNTPAYASKSAMTLSGRILKADADLRMVFGIVMCADDEAVRVWKEAGQPADTMPDVVDTQGEYIGEATLIKAFEEYMRRYAKSMADRGMALVGVGHKRWASDVVMLQSAVLPKGSHWPDADSPALTAAKNWVCCDWIGNDKLWDAVKAGELTGYSIGGVAENG